MLYNFRIDRDHVPEILRRLKEERLLSQGWGGGEEIDLRIDRDDCIERCKDYYKLATTRIPSNLTRMKDFKDGDVVVVPHLPEHRKASVHIIDGDFPECYDYLDKDPFHLNHRIRVRESFGLEGNISIYNAHLASWYGKLQWLQFPILRIPKFEGSFREIIERLRANPGTRFDASELDEYLESLLKGVVTFVMKKLNQVSPTHSSISFESTCERLLTSEGYRIVGRNIYDKTGGDVDLRCTRERIDLSPFEAGQTVLLVQVKKYTGTTGGHAVEQLLKMIEGEPAADGCVMSLAEKFSDEAQALADKNGILLMNGEAICKLLLASIV